MSDAPCPPDELLAQFAEGSLSTRELTALEGHLDGCSTCRDLLNVMRGGKSEDSRGGWLSRDSAGTVASGTIVGGRYRIGDLIGKGGMGEVYRAQDLMLRTPVALKSLTVSSLAQDETQKRLRREVLIARQVTHPNVCRIFDFGLTDELCFLTMEYVEGTTLRKYLGEHGPLQPNDARPFVYQMTLGLQAAHNAGVIHRDFKSDNVLLGDSKVGPPRVLVTDFGLAKPVAPGTPISTLGGRFAGTLTHAAPEQLRGEAVTPQTDVYAVGVVLFEMVTGGKLPTLGKTPLEMAQNRINNVAPSPRSHVPDVDAQWEAVIAQCLERDPGQRPPRPDAVYRALYPS